MLLPVLGVVGVVVGVFFENALNCYDQSRRGVKAWSMMFRCKHSARSLPRTFTLYPFRAPGSEPLLNIYREIQNFCFSLNNNGFLSVFYVSSTLCPPLYPFRVPVSSQREREREREREPRGLGSHLALNKFSTPCFVYHLRELTDSL